MHRIVHKSVDTVQYNAGLFCRTLFRCVCGTNSRQNEYIRLKCLLSVAVCIGLLLIILIKHVQQR